MFGIATDYGLYKPPPVPLLYSFHTPVLVLPFKISWKDFDVALLRKTRPYAGMGSASALGSNYSPFLLDTKRNPSRKMTCWGLRSKATRQLAMCRSGDLRFTI